MSRYSGNNFKGGKHALYQVHLQLYDADRHLKSDSSVVSESDVSIKEIKIAFRLKANQI
jgi:hypothetical protein